MAVLTTRPKLLNFFEQNIVNQLEDWFSLLLKGDIHKFETQLSESLSKVYDQIGEQLLSTSAQVLEPLLVQAAKKEGCQKIRPRELDIRLATGTFIQVKSPYVKKPSITYNRSRHLLAKHWHLQGSATPLLYDKVGFCAALGPSYDIACQTLTKFGVNIGLSSVRKISNKLAQSCHEKGEPQLATGLDETLDNKRVVIALDGGRTRTRQYDGTYTPKGYQQYETAWCEPKLFVIDILNDKGVVDRRELPIYGCRFDQQELFDLLRDYLIKLEITKARSIQILGDGAPWIWNNIRSILLDIGVESTKITETLDAYHGTGYVHKLVDMMNTRKSEFEKRKLRVKYLSWFWEGKSKLIVDECRNIFKRAGELTNRYLSYLEKHEPRTQYAEYKENKLMCGSGIIESGIRRIINLRFKNASTFWDKQIVEKLYFLRAALLSKRWDMVIQNIAV